MCSKGICPYEYINNYEKQLENFIGARCLTLPAFEDVPPKIKEEVKGNFNKIDLLKDHVS